MLSVFDQGQPHACPPNFNLVAYGLRYASKTPDKTALELVSGQHKDVWSYRRLERAVLATGAGLLAKGLRPGDLILLRLGHSVDFPLCFLGAIAVGLVPVPCSAQLTERETAKIIQNLAPAAILYDPALACPAIARLPGAAYQILDVATLRTLRHALSAGEKMPDALQQAWTTTTGAPVYEAYGMSECSTFISASPSHPARPGCVGRPQTGRRVAIVDTDGPVAIGTQGMIAVSRDDQGLMLGYRNAPLTLEKLWVGDWFVTADQGIMAQDGQITYCGRADDIMTAGGYRVSPVEVEAALRLFCGLGDIAVTEVEIKPQVRVIAAFYTGVADLDEPAVKHFVKAHLARYKRPRIYVRISELQTGPNNKVMRRKLREFYKANA